MNIATFSFLHPRRSMKNRIRSVQSRLQGMWRKWWPVGCNSIYWRLIDVLILALFAVRLCLCFIKCLLRCSKWIFNKKKTTYLAFNTDNQDVLNVIELWVMAFSVKIVKYLSLLYFSDKIFACWGKTMVPIPLTFVANRFLGKKKIWQWVKIYFTVLLISSAGTYISQSVPLIEGNTTFTLDVNREISLHSQWQ